MVYEYKCVYASTLMLVRAQRPRRFSCAVQCYVLPHVFLVLQFYNPSQLRVSTERIKHGLADPDHFHPADQRVDQAAIDELMGATTYPGFSASVQIVAYFRLLLANMQKFVARDSLARVSNYMKSTVPIVYLRSLLILPPNATVPACNSGRGVRTGVSGTQLTILIRY
jgi:hypothetical protein